MSDKVDFKAKSLTKDKERHYIMMNGSIEDDITFINIYSANKGAPKHIKQILTDIKGETDSNKMIVVDFNIPLTSMDRAFKEKTVTLNDTLDQLDLVDIYRTLDLKTAEYTFFSTVYGTFSRIDYMLSHKTSLSKFKKIEIVLSVFSEHKAIILENNY